jgi:spore coat-associated protein N
MKRRLNLPSQQTRRLATGAVLLSSVVALATIGAGATFQDTVQDDISVTSGNVDIRLGTGANNAAEANRFSVDATGLAAGDTIQRSFNVINAGTLNLADIALTTTATTSSALDTDATDGLQLKLDECSQPWTEAGIAPAYTYTCGGTANNDRIASRPVIGSDLALTGSAALTAGATAHYRLTMTLPSTATQPTFSGKTSVIQYAFTATQRTATNR